MSTDGPIRPALSSHPSRDDELLDSWLTPLLHHLTLVASSSLWIVVVPALSLQRRVADNLGGRLRDTHFITEFAYSPQDLSLAEKLRRLPAPTQEQAILFVYDIDGLSSKHRRQAINLLNRGREALADTPYSVILFVLPPTVPELIYRAGDFWVWRSGVSDLSQLPTAVITASERLTLQEQYLQVVMAQYRSTQLFGVTTTRPLTVDLESLYVPITYLRPDRPGLWQTEGGVRERFQATMAMGTRENLTEIWRAVPHLVVLGGPGSGKTTWLRYLLLTYAQGKQAVRERLGVDETRLPLFVPLRLLGEALQDGRATDLLTFLPGFLSLSQLSGATGLLLDSLQEGHCLLLLDGLDEVSPMALRRQAQDSLVALSRRYPGNRLVVSSRPGGYELSPLSDGFPLYELPEWDRVQVATYAERWSKAANRLQPLIRETLSYDFLSAIRRNPRLQQLSTNPLFLSLMLLIHSSRVSLPESRIRLYEEVTDIFLSGQTRFRESQKLHLERTMQLDLLSVIGYWLQTNQPDGSATEAELLSLIQAYLGSILEPGNIPPPTKLLDYFSEQAGILTQAGPETFRFSHRVLQEYFAAREIVRSNRTIQVIEAHLHQSRWVEPIRLAIALAAQRGREAERLIRAIVQAQSPYEELLHRDLLLAAECLVEAEGVQRTLAQDILGQMLTIFFDVEEGGRYRSLVESIIRILAEFAGSYLFEMEIRPALARGLLHTDPRLRTRCAEVLRLVDGATLPELEAIDEETEAITSPLSVDLKDTDAAYQAAEDLARQLRAGLSIPASADPAGNATFEALSDIVAYLTEAGQFTFP